MYIIPQVITDVNPFERWTEKKVLSEQMAAKMLDAGYKARAARMLACNDVMSFVKCKECGRMHINRATLCRDRFCPVCQWRLSKQRYEGMKQIMQLCSDEYPNAVFTFCTLTVKNCYANQLKETMQAMAHDWTKLLARNCTKAARGWARSCEITYNEGARTVHPHYHVIVMWDSYEDAEMYAEEILDAWVKMDRENRSKLAQHTEYVYRKDLTDDSANVKAALEATKYMTKASDMLKMRAGDFYNVVEQISGKRMTAFGGAMKEFKKIAQVELEEVMEERHNGACTACGSIKTHEVLVKWCGGRYQEVIEAQI